MIYSVVCAHPDDEVLGCGGTMARLAREGHAVHTLIIGTGAYARGGESPQAKAQAAALRVAADKAAKSLGIAALSFPEVHPPDNTFDLWPRLRLVKLIEDWLREVRPATVLTHTPACLNVDHRRTAEAVITAARPLLTSVKSIWTFPIASSTEWTANAFGSFAPNLYVMMTPESWGRKIEAMRHYKVELRPFPHPRSETGLEAQAKVWGMMAGVERAEAFQVLREVR